MSLKDAAARSIAWSAVQTWGTQIASLLVVVILARLLDPAAFGLLAMGLTFTSAIQLFVDQGLGEALIQRRELGQTHLDTAFWATLTAGVLLMIAAAALALPVAAFFGEPRLVGLIRALAPAFVAGALSTVPNALLRRQLAFRTLAARSLLSVIPAGVIGIVLAVRGFGVWSLVVQSLTVSFLTTALIWQASGYKPGLGVTWSAFRELFSFGGQITATYVVNLLSRKADDVIIGVFLGPVALGYYTIAYQVLLSLTRLLTGVTASAMLPVFSRLQDDRARLRDALFATTRFTSLLAFPVFALLAGLAPDLLRVLFGDSWLPAASALRMLALVGVLHSIFYFNATAFVALGRPGLRFVVTLANAAANVAAFLFAVRWGIAGVATAYAATAFLLAPLPLVLLGRLLHFNHAQYVRQIALPAAAAGAAVGAAVLCRVLLFKDLELHAAVAASVILSVGVYALLLRLAEPQLIGSYMSLARKALRPAARSC